MSESSSLVNHQISEAWILEQASDETTLRQIQNLINCRLEFLKTGIPPTNTEPIILKMRGGNFCTSLAGHYSFLRVYSEIFEKNEHAKHPAFENIDGVVIDVGACEGYYSISMALKNRQCRVIAIEPNPEAYKILVKNIELNSLQNRVSCLNVAVSSTVGVTEMKVVPGVPNISSLESADAKSNWLNGKYSKSISVNTESLAKVFKDNNLSSIDLLKIDAEGSEAEVLLSLSDLTPSCKKIVVECHSKELKNKVSELLRTNGFNLVLEDIDNNINFDYLGNLYFESRDLS